MTLTRLFSVIYYYLYFVGTNHLCMLELILQQNKRSLIRLSQHSFQIALTSKNRIPNHQSNRVTLDPIISQDTYIGFIYLRLALNSS